MVEYSRNTTLHYILPCNYTYVRYAEIRLRNNTARQYKGYYSQCTAKIRRRKPYLKLYNVYFSCMYICISPVHAEYFSDAIPVEV